MRFLGLEAGIMGMSARGTSAAASGGMLPEKKPRNTTIEWNEFEKSRLSHSNITPTTLSAITVAASLLGLSSENSQELMEGASIVHAPPGAFVSGKEEPSNAIYLILEGTLEVGLEKNVAIGRTRPQVPSFDGSERRKAWRTKQPSSRLMSLANQDQSSSFKPLFIATPGIFCGLSSCFTRSSLISVRNPAHAKDSAMLLKMSASTLESVVSRHPRVLIRCLLDIIDMIGDGGMSKSGRFYLHDDVKLIFLILSSQNMMHKQIFVSLLLCSFWTCPWIGCMLKRESSFRLRASHVIPYSLS
jgi:hypothetical protein